MVVLSRTVRFSINPGDPGSVVLSGPNGYAGVPSAHGLARHYELVVRCRGVVDAQTGYFMDIKAIDRAVRASAVTAIARACADDAQADPARLLHAMVSSIDGEVGGRLASVRWRVTPYYSVEVDMRDQSVSVVRQKFEFAAAHRLHAPDLTPEQNRAMFGKCNLPNAHGHNYIVEPAVVVKAGSKFSLGELERVTNQHVIEKLDHLHLNKDVDEFRDGSGVNPSVENIARVCYQWLTPHVKAMGAELREVTVWETEKTCATFPG
jgi:6-pyruvoyltetrahydropterin/6-carboxytetrahydropterin synthase